MRVADAKGVLLTLFVLFCSEPYGRMRCVYASLHRRVVWVALRKSKGGEVVQEVNSL